MPSNEWIDLLLIAARDVHVLIAILFFLGIALILISIVDIPKYGVKPENQKKAFLSGIAIAALSGVILVALFVNCMAVDVSGLVKNEDGSPVRNVNVSIGTHNAKTNRDGFYSIPLISRDERQIAVKIKEKLYHDTLDMPYLSWKKNKDILIMPINLTILGEVQDVDGKAVEGAWVNISWDKDLSQKTDSKGKFNFGHQEVPFVPAVPMRLFVQLSLEPQPRNKEVLEIPSEEPYEIYYPVTLMPKDWVSVSGQVFLKESYTDMNRKEFPDVTVKMADKTGISRKDGSYFLRKVPINTSRYLIVASDETILANHTINPILREGVKMPRIADLFVYRNELNDTL
jgi:hypothetical protein